jgi:hypothetical protein
MSYDIDKLIRRTGTEDIAPLVHGIYALESSSGQADTKKANVSGAKGPMQVTKQTFQDLKNRGYIPKNYKWNNAAHLAEAGVANIGYLSNRFNTTDPRVIAAAYYGGPSAVNKDGTINEGRQDPKHPNYPTVGGYADRLHGYITKNYPDFLPPPPPPLATDLTPSQAPTASPLAMAGMNIGQPMSTPFKYGGFIERTTYDRKIL